MELKITEETPENASTICTKKYNMFVHVEDCTTASKTIAMALIKPLSTYDFQIRPRLKHQH